MTMAIWDLVPVIYVTIMTTIWTVTSANEGYLVVMPKLFRPNVEEVLSVTILKPTEPIYVEAKLFSASGHLIAENGHEIFGKGTLKVKTPADIKGLCTLKICGNCRSTRLGAFSFYNSTIVSVEEKGTSVFLQTDKPVYKPGQTVHINVFLTGPDLQPVNSALVLSLMDPNNSHITKWTDLRPLCCGLINVSFPISEQPVLGKWTLLARVQGHVYKRQFDVRHYVLPKYEVSIEAPSFVRDWNKCENVTVTTRYTFGQSVHGLVKLQYSVHGIGYYEDHFSRTHEQHSEIHGTASFNVCLGKVVSKKFPDHFRGQLHLLAEVTTPDGSSVQATDHSCPVNKQLVDLQFSKDTRRTFKPGLPFKGRILVQYPDGSAANNVTVYIEALVDGIDFSRQSVSTSNGHAPFYIPALPAVSQSLSLNARIASIDKQPAPEYYFSAYLTVNSWYSPSKCHLLIDSKQNKYQVGEEGTFMIHSTCPCNLDMYYEVKARGNIVHSGIHFSRHQHKLMNPPTDFSSAPVFFRQEKDYGPKTCTVFIKFLITYEMAPLSRLLVYYVRPGGEGVADAIVFETVPDFRNKMSVELSDPDALPGEEIKLHVHTRPGSCVCLGAVDKSVYLLKPDYLLSKDQIFAELATYDIDDQDTYYDSERRRNKRSTWQIGHVGMPVKDAQYAFEECGLLVMTDTVSLQFKQQKDDDGIYFEGLSYEYQIEELIAEQKKHIHEERTRVYFPETWIWQCFNTSSTRKQTPIVVQVPDSITTWMFSGVSMSPKHGFSLATPASLRTFQYFFLDMNLPYSVVRGEQVKIPLIIHNYLHACVQVHLELHIPSAMDILHGKEKLKKFCIGNEETKTLFYDMTFRQIGMQKLSASAEAYADSRCCSDILSDVSPHKRFLTGTDSIKQQILVEAEGIPRFYTHSVYFCPNSRIHLSTQSKYQFQYVARPPEMSGFTFSVKAKNDARIALSPGPKDHNQMVEIVIGGDFNKQSWIMLADTEVIVANLTTPGIISEEEFRPFWISWKNAAIRIGWGTTVGEQRTEFLSYKAKKALFVEYIGFSTGWGAEGEFTIWERREMDYSGYGEVMYLSLPDSAIPGSAFAKAKLTGDLMGPSIHHLDKMLRLPQGCGEQNMANFAPNVYILQYLTNTAQLREDVKLHAIKLLTKGYQRQLTYMRQDGSYSAFGYRDATGNTWLSAFVLKTLGQASKYIYIDEDGLQATKLWLINRQRPDGSFESLGRLFNKEIQGGLPGRVALTAYILTALRHVGANTKVEHMAVFTAQKYLEKSVDQIDDPYTAALTAYALSLLNSDRAFSVLKILSQMAIKRNGMTYWRLYHHDIREFHLFNEEPSRIKVSSAEIEIAGYAALAYMSKNDIASAFPIIKWVTTQRNSYGGFHSTQDTVVALQALSQYAILSYSSSLAMTVSLASTNMDLLEKFELNTNNSDVIQSVIVPSLPARLFLSASGDGCAMFQVEVQYNVPDATDRPSFDLSVRLGQHRKSSDHRHFHKAEVHLTFETCTKWLHPGSSNMAVMEVTIMTGYEPDKATLDNLLEQSNLRLKRYEHSERQVNFYFDEIRSGCMTCLSFELIRKFKVEDSASVSIKIYDYYEPEYEAEILYNASFIGGLHSTADNGTDCSSMFGCADSVASHSEVVLCSCYRDCHEAGLEVCASDGKFYASYCHMAVYSCHNDIHLEEMPRKYCEVQDLWSGEGSGDLLEFAKYGSTVSWSSFLLSNRSRVTPAHWMPTPRTLIIEDNTSTTTMADMSYTESNEVNGATQSTEKFSEDNKTALKYDGVKSGISVLGAEVICEPKQNCINATLVENWGTNITRNNTEYDLLQNARDDNVDKMGVDRLNIDRDKVLIEANTSMMPVEASDVTHAAADVNQQEVTHAHSGHVLKLLQPTTMRMLQLKYIKDDIKQSENIWKKEPGQHTNDLERKPVASLINISDDLALENNNETESAFDDQTDDTVVDNGRISNLQGLFLDDVDISHMTDQQLEAFIQRNYPVDSVEYLDQNEVDFTDSRLNILANSEDYRHLQEGDYPDLVTKSTGLYNMVDTIDDPIHEYRKENVVNFPGENNVNTVQFDTSPEKLYLDEDKLHVDFEDIPDDALLTMLIGLNAENETFDYLDNRYDALEVGNQTVNTSMFGPNTADNKSTEIVNHSEELKGNVSLDTDQKLHLDIVLTAEPEVYPMEEDEVSASHVTDTELQLHAGNTENKDEVPEAKFDPA